MRKYNILLLLIKNVSELSLIQTVTINSKNIAKIEHFSKLTTKALSRISIYRLFDKKPAIDVKFINGGQLLFYL